MSEPAATPASTPSRPPPGEPAGRGGPAGAGGDGPRGTAAREFWAELGMPGRWLLSTVALTHLGRGATLPFTIIYVHEVRGIGLDTAGLLMGIIAVVALAVTGPSGALIDRVGARLMMLAATVAQLAGALVLALADSVPLFAVGFTLVGLNFGIAWPAINALISSVVGPSLRTQFFGLNFALLNLGIGVGGVVAGFIVDVHRPWTFTAIFLADAACMLIPLAVFLGPLRRVHGRAEQPHEDAPPGSYLAILRRPVIAWVCVLTFVSSLVGYGQMESGFPAFARQVGVVPTRAIGFAFALNTAVIVLLQFPVLRRIVGRRRTRVFMVLAVLWALSWLVLGATALVPGGLLSAALVIGAMLPFALGETMLQPTMPAMVNDLADAHTRGRYNAATAAAFQIGAIAGPALAGWLLARRLGTGFIAAMVVGCLSLIVLARVVERHVPAEANGVTAP